VAGRASDSSTVALCAGRSRHGVLRFDMKSGSRRTLRVHLPPAVLRRASHGRLRLRGSAVPDTVGVFIPQRRFVRVAVPARAP